MLANIGLPRARLIATVLAVAAVAAAALVAASARYSPFAPRPLSYGSFAMEAQWSLDELMRRSDVVVVAVPRGERVVPFVANTDVPAQDRDIIYRKGAYLDVTLDVLEYVKGNGPRQISWRANGPSPDLQIDVNPQISLDQGRTYVLFLERGKGVWVGGFRPMASYGVGIVTGDAADLGILGRVSLADIRSTAKRTP